MNPTYVTAKDSTYTLAPSITSGMHSEYLQGYNYRFDLDIPTGSTILGIEARIYRRATNADQALDYGVYIHTHNSGLSGDNKADTGTNWPTSVDYKYYGASDNLWGGSWTRTQVCATDFCLSLSVTGDDAVANTCHVDSFEVRITYQEP